MHRKINVSLLGLILASVGGTAGALDFSFTGTFGQDDDVRLFNFSVDAPSEVTLRSLSYAGGTNAAGASIPAGGFDPILTLFDGGGNLVTDDDDGGTREDPNTGLVLDAQTEAELAPGDYTVSITQFNNFANGPTLSEGFEREGQGNFTAREVGLDEGMFFDFEGNLRTGFFAIDILNVNFAEPGEDLITMPPQSAIEAGLDMLEETAGLTPNQGSVGRAIAAICGSNASGLSDDCGPLARSIAAGDPAAQTALAAITAEEASVALDASQTSIAVQNQNVGLRLAALRGGVLGVSGRGFTLRQNGRTVSGE
ncbi:MAG: DVUA0089 family protein, partial [Pseudomonadota bacterium]|nr:DVUA0089 family protein [Pseudomonadota bacterium]